MLAHGGRVTHRQTCDEPFVGNRDPIAVVESVKAASDIRAPMGREVIETNPEVEAEPALVNTDPYGKRLAVQAAGENPAGVSSLMDAAGYEKTIH